MEEPKIEIEKSIKNKKSTKYNFLDIPGSIQIGNKTYVFKEQLKSDKNAFTYRCKKFSCRIPITINRENLNKYMTLIIMKKFNIS